MAIEYDENTKKLLQDVQKADALSGSRGNAFMQQAAARGIQAAGENGSGAGMAFMGMGMQSAGGMMGTMQQQPTASPYQPSFAQQTSNEVVQPQQTQNSTQTDVTTKLLEMKKLLDAGAISQEDYDKVKAQLLGL